MYYVRLLFLLVSLTALGFMVVGLFKPWLLLWWEDVQNRKKVLLVYGTTAIIFLIIYFVTGLLTNT